MNPRHFKQGAPLSTQRVFCRKYFDCPQTTRGRIAWLLRDAGLMRVVGWKNRAQESLAEARRLRTEARQIQHYKCAACGWSLTHDGEVNFCGRCGRVVAVLKGNTPSWWAQMLNSAGQIQPTGGVAIDYWLKSKREEFPEWIGSDSDFFDTFTEIDG